MQHDLDVPGLIAACRRGDPSSWARLVEMQYGALLALARRLAGADRAQDLTQSFLLDAMERGLLSKFRGDSLLSMAAFLKACLRNYFKNELRQQEPIDHYETMDEFAVVRQALPEDQLISRENLEKIEKAFQSLRLEYKQILELEGRSYRHKEIAALLGMPQGTVSAYSSRAKDELRAHLRAARVFLAFLTPAILSLALQSTYWFT